MTEPALSGASSLPELTAIRLHGDTRLIARRMTRRIAEEYTLPERFSTVGNLRAVTRACRDALETLLRVLHDGQGLRQGDLERLGAMGTREAQSGVPLEVLLGAYRIAARVLWEDFIGQSVENNELAPQAVVSATGYVLEYFDLISSAVGTSYLATRERLVRQRDRDRDRLLQQLLAGDIPDEIHHVAASVELALTPPYRVIAFRTDIEHTDAVERAWRDRSALLVAAEHDITVALVPPNVAVETIQHRLKGDGIALQCAVGPIAHSLAEIAQCARRARDALDVGATLRPDHQLYRWAELAPLGVLAGERNAARAFVDQELSALGGLTPARREDMLATISAVINTPSMAAAAELLFIHRHTLVYRLQRLADLGIDLSDTTRCHQLWLALQLDQLLK